MGAFTTKSVSQHDSPFTPPNPRNKNVAGRFRNRGAASAINTDAMFTTFGTIPLEAEVDVERDGVEMDDVHLGLNLHLGNLNTAAGGEDGEPIPENESNGGSPAPAYNSLEMGYRGHGGTSIESGVGGIRVNVEKATSER